MLVLALDTCFNRCAAILFDSTLNLAVASESRSMEKGHAEALAPMVQRLFESAGLQVSALGRIAVTTGPGTFTGVRIGLSFARAMGLARSISVIGMDTLSAVALALPSDEMALIAHSAGRSGFAYVQQAPSKEVELWSWERLRMLVVETTGLVLGTAAPALELLPEDRRRPLLDLPDLARLARFAAQAEKPDRMPEPVYVREADAKPQGFGEITLRAAGSDDLGALAQLHHASFAAAWSEREFADMLAVPGTQALLLDAEGQPAGFLLLRAIAGEAELLSLGIAPAKRRRGLGSRLLQGLSALVKEHAIEKVSLEVSSANTAAHTLYEHHGFTQTGLRKAYYADGTDAVLMARTFS